MGRCEFPQPEGISREGGQTSLEGQSDQACPDGVVRPAWLGGQAPPQKILGDLVFEVVIRVVSVLVVVVLVVGMVSLVVLSVLDIIHLILNSRVRGAIALSWRGATVHDLPFLSFVLLQRDGSNFLMVVSVLVEMVG
jgi:hypothetical protein